MTDEIVAKLVEANLKLTEQVVGLATEVIRAQERQTPPQSTYEQRPAPDAPPEVFEPFTLTTADDWEDIPPEPMAGSVPAGEPPTPTLQVVPQTKRLHLSEEEEDAMAAFQLGHISKEELEKVLARAELPNTHIDFIQAT